MSTIYDMSFDENQVKHALSRLGEILREDKESLEVAVAGGIVSLLYFKNRASTRDIDAIFPDDHFEKEALKSAIMKVGKELGLETGLDDTWMNNDIETFGLNTKSDIVLFENEGLKVVAASFEEQLSQKLCAYRNKQDVDDAEAILKELMPEYKDNLEGLFKQVYNLKPFVSKISEEQLKSRFDNLVGLVTANFEKSNATSNSDKLLLSLGEEIYKPNNKAKSAKIIKALLKEYKGDSERIYNELYSAKPDYITSMELTCAFESALIISVRDNEEESSLSL